MLAEIETISLLDKLDRKTVQFLRKRATFLDFAFQLKNDYKIDIFPAINPKDTKFTAKTFKIVYKQLYDKVYSDFLVYEDDFENPKRMKRFNRLWNLLIFINDQDFCTENLSVHRDASFNTNIYIKYKNKVDQYTFNWSSSKRKYPEIEFTHFGINR